MKNIDENIKKSEFLNLYLIFGNEEYLKKEYENKFIKAIVSESTKLMNFNYFEGKGVTYEDVFNVAETIPFMAKNRLIILRDSGFFYEGKKAETDKLAEYISKIPETTIILFLEKNVDKRLKIFKEVKKFGYIAEATFLKEKELSDWVLNIFNENGKKIDVSTAIYLIRFVGTEMEVLFNEINKLLDFSGINDFIKKEDINKICTKSLEVTIFELVAAIGNKNTAKAIELYNNLIVNKNSPFMILTMISRQFRLILQVKYLHKMGKNQAEIAKELNIREFVAKDCLSQAKNFTNKSLLDAISDCLHTDLNIKTGKMKENIAIEILIAKYAS